MSILPLLSYVRRRRDVRIEGEKVQWPAAPMPQIEVNVSEETRVTHVPCSQQIYNARYMHAYRHSARPNDDKSCIGQHAIWVALRSREVSGRLPYASQRSFFDYIEARRCTKYFPQISLYRSNEYVQSNQFSFDPFRNDLKVSINHLIISYLKRATTFSSTT